MYKKIDESPCFHKGPSAKVTRPWYSDEAECSEKFDGLQCTKCDDQFYPSCAAFGGYIKAKSDSCSSCRAACPTWTDHFETFRFLSESGAYA